MDENHLFHSLDGYGLKYYLCCLESKIAFRDQLWLPPGIKPANLKFVENFEGGTL